MSSAGIHSIDDFLTDLFFMAACCLMVISCMRNVLSGTLGFFLSRPPAVPYSPSTVVLETTAGKRTQNAHSAEGTFLIHKQ